MLIEIHDGSKDKEERKRRIAQNKELIVKKIARCPSLKGLLAHGLKFNGVYEEELGLYAGFVRVIYSKPEQAKEAERLFERITPILGMRTTIQLLKIEKSSEACWGL